MMNLSQISINFCGENRYFKRCPTQELKDYQKTMDKIQEDLKPDLEEINNLKEEIEEIIQDYDDNIDIINSLKETKNEKTNGLTQETVDKIIKLKTEQKKSRKTIREKQKELKELTNKMIKNQDQANDIIIDAYDNLCIKLIDNFNPGEFKNNYDVRDQAIAMHLGTIYALYMSGKSEKIINKQLEEIIDSQVDQLKQFSSFQS